MTLSDTHLGMPSWGTFGEDVFAAARKKATHEPVDVVLHNGDIVEPESGLPLEAGLDLLQQIPAQHHLWVAGNNDIQYLFGQSPILEYPEVLQRQASPYGIQLLDYSPLVIGDITFVGNFGFYDLSLWKKSDKPSDKFPNTLEDLRADAKGWHKKNLGVGIDDFFRFCQDRLRAHLRQMQDRAAKLVVATHTVPSPEMVLYGHSAEFDYRNAWMGWDDSLSSNPLHSFGNVALQFCGHTHRHKITERKGLSPLINLSGKEQPLIFNL